MKILEVEFLCSEQSIWTDDEPFKIKLAFLIYRLIQQSVGRKVGKPQWQSEKLQRQMLSICSKIYESVGRVIVTGVFWRFFSSRAKK